MWRFLMPRPDGTTFDLAIGAKNLADAFEQFSEWWTPDLDRAIGVWLNGALVAKVVPVVDAKSGELQPHVKHLKP